MNRPEQAIAKLESASKRYGAVLALDQVSLDLRRGEVFAVLGPNGAGKTTAILLLLGLLHPDTGSAQLFGELPQSSPLAAASWCDVADHVACRTRSRSAN